jgi:hypothetical protein
MHISSRAIKVIGVILGSLIAVAITLSLIFGSSLVETSLLTPNKKFKGIGPNFEKRTTSVIIVHGIGHHCLGYADNLVSNLFNQLTERETESIEESYDQYVMQINDNPDDYPYISPLRDGSCRVIDDIEYSVDPERLNLDNDLESVVLSQDSLCESINNDKTSDSGVAVSCHKLFVKRKHTVYENENPEYVTGFIRRFSTDLTADRRLRIYEVTWSPATRWIKQSLMDLERFNDPDSEHPLNRRVKSEVINAGIADAVAYLSDSGILVNFDILQAFCLTLANTNSLYEEYPFVCDQSSLSGATRDFSKDNDIYFISHSLGTRVLFDSIGMLALGTVEPKLAQESGPTLVSSIATKFQRIGAVVPEEYTNTSESEPTFISALNAGIPEFAKAIRSIFVFTNQVPLLAANLTSPFQNTNDVGMGFQRFLELRSPINSSSPRLQVVSFHDPDDVLSYNLGCWYYQTILKQFDETKEVINREAEARATRNGTEIGHERANLRKTLFTNNCTDSELKIENRHLFSQIWAVGANRIKLVNAAVRLKGLRLSWIAADPMAVHSNYFVDETVHEWLAKGN